MKLDLVCWIQQRLLADYTTLHASSLLTFWLIVILLQHSTRTCKQCHDSILLHTYLMHHGIRPLLHPAKDCPYWPHYVHHHCWHFGWLPFCHIVHAAWSSIHVSGSRGHSLLLFCHPCGMVNIYSKLLVHWKPTQNGICRFGGGWTIPHSSCRFK